MSEEQQLKKSINFPTLVILAITSVMGSGIFFVPAISVEMSGSSAIISWILVALLGFSITLYFSELASMFPKVGGVYEFAKQAYNKFIGFLIGWTEWIIGNLTTSMLIVSGMQFLSISKILPENSLIKIILAIVTLIIFNYIAFRGIEFSSKFVMVFGILQLGIILFSTILMLYLAPFSLDNFSPFFIKNNPKDNIINLLVTLIFISDVFLGMESIFSLSEETKNPEKTIPRAVITAQTILTLIAILSLIAIINYYGVNYIRNNNSSNPAWTYINLAKRLLGNKGSVIYSIIIFLSILGSAADWIVSAPRLLMAMAKDKVFIPQLEKIHPVYKTPYRAIIFQTIIMIIFSIIGLILSGYKTLVQILMPLSFLMIITLLFAAFYLRIKKPNIKRPFKAPFGKIGPLATISVMTTILLIWIKFQENAQTLFSVAFSFILIGFPFYLLIQFYTNKKINKKLNNILTKAYIILEPLDLPKKIRKEILSLINQKQNKRILEIGCGVGTLTKEILMNTRGIHLISLDQEEKNVNITKTRVEKLVKKGKINKKNTYKLVYDPELKLKLNNKYDVVIINQMLDSISNFDSFLDRLYNILTPTGQIYLIEFCDLFGFLPNPPYLMDEKKFEETFRKHGFIVRLMKKAGLFWNYLIIYGFKIDKNIKEQDITVI